MTIQNKLFIMLACLSIFCTQISYSVETVKTKTNDTEINIKTKTKINNTKIKTTPEKNTTTQITTEAGTCHNCIEENALSPIRIKFNKCKKTLQKKQCALVSPSRLMNCNDEDSYGYSIQEIILGCLQGVFDFTIDGTSLFWNMLKGMYNSGSNIRDNYIEELALSKATKLYLVNEYDKADDPIASLGINIIPEVIAHLDDKFIKEFECLNVRSQTDQACYVTSSILAIWAIPTSVGYVGKMAVNKGTKVVNTSRKVIAKNKAAPTKQKTTAQKKSNKSSSKSSIKTSNTKTTSNKSSTKN